MIRLQHIKSYLAQNAYWVWAILLYALSLFVLISPPAREFWQRRFAPPNRQVIAVATGAIFRDGRIHRVVKVMTPKGIVVEVYGPFENGVQKMIDSILIPDRRDAFFDLHGRATNLALKDMDADGMPEIIAPSYDRSGVAHLNVYTYSEDTNKFLPYLE